MLRTLTWRSKSRGIIMTRSRGVAPAPPYPRYRSRGQDFLRSIRNHSEFGYYVQGRHRVPFEHHFGPTRRSRYRRGHRIYMPRLNRNTAPDRNRDPVGYWNARMHQVQPYFSRTAEWRPYVRRSKRGYRRSTRFAHPA